METVEELRKYSRAAERGTNPETRTPGLIVLPGGLLVRADMLGMRGVPRDATIEIKEDRVEIRWTRGFTRIKGVERKLTGGLDIPGEQGGILPPHHPDADPTIHRLRKAMRRPLSPALVRRIDLAVASKRIKIGDVVHTTDLMDHLLVESWATKLLLEERNRKIQEKINARIAVLEERAKCE